MKKLTTLTIVATSALLLAACGNNSSSKDSTSSKDKSASVSRAKAKSSSKAKASSESKAKAVSESKAKASSEAAASSKAKADSESQAAASSSAAAASSSAAASSAAASSSQAAQASVKPLTNEDFELVETIIWSADKTFVESQIADQQWVKNKMGVQSDGSFVLDTYSGAKGLNVYTVIPKPNDQYEVVSQYGSMELQDSIASWSKITKTVPNPFGENH